MSDDYDIQDFTNASAWEKFISQLEMAIREHAELFAQAGEPLTRSTSVTFEDCEYHLHYFRDVPKEHLHASAQFPDALLQLGSKELPPIASSERHPLLRWYSLSQLLLLTPALPTDDATTFVTNDQASMLLSSLIMAATACQCALPVFVVHGRVRGGIEQAWIEQRPRYQGHVGLGPYAVFWSCCVSTFSLPRRRLLCPCLDPHQP